MSDCLIEVIPLPRHVEAQVFYSSVGYTTAIVETDLVVGATIDGTLVGVVRISSEHDCSVLRGMMIAEEHQRKGVGTKMLSFLEQRLTAECHCLPHTWLETFYGQIDFERMTEQDAPVHLRQRLNDYRSDFPTLMYMRRKAQQ